MKRAYLLLIALGLQCSLTYTQCPDPWCINNGNFNDLNVFAYVDGLFAFYNMGNEGVECWHQSHGSPTIMMTPGCTDQSCAEDAALMWAINNFGTGASSGEGIYQDHQIYQDHKYFYTYKVKRTTDPFGPASSPSAVDNFYFKFITYPGANFIYAGTAVIPTAASEQIVSHTTNIASFSYSTICGSITADANYQAVWLYPEQNYDHSGSRGTVKVTDVALIDVYAGEDKVICNGQSTPLGIYSCITAYTPVTYSWSPSIGLSSTTVPNPTCTLTNTGLTPITQTYTLTATYTCNGTPMTLTDQVTVTVNPLIVSTITGDQSVCPGDVVNYTITNYDPSNTYNIIVNGGTYTQSGSTLTVTWGSTPGSGAVYIMTTTPSTPPCSGSFTLPITINPLPALPIISGFMQTCNYGPTPYTITNAQASTTYSWTVTGGTPSTGSGTSLGISWTGGGGTITILATNTITGCTNTQTFTIQPCCDPVGSWLTTWNNHYDQSSEMLTFSGTPVEVYGQTIGINDVFTVDQNIIFSFCDIYMGPNAKIIMNSGATLAIRDSRVQACTDMWDGIYAGGTNRVDIINSEVYDGKNALVSTNGPIINVENSQFINNYVALSFNNHNTFSPVHIFRSTFKYDLFLGGLRPPYSGQKGLCGIKLNNVFQIQIGDPAFAIYKNYFMDMNYGVYSQKSYYSIVNNEFSGFNNSQDPSNPFLGAAIYSLSPHPVTLLSVFPNPDPSVSYIGKTATINNGIFKSNSFKNNDIGVFMIDHAKTDIFTNDFIEHSKVGVWSLWGRNGKSIRITDNTMDNTNTPSTIHAGIAALEGGTSNSARYYIANNEINNIHQGINVQNAFGPRILKNTINVIDPIPGQSWSWGVLNRNTLRSDIQNNYVTGPNFGTSTIGIFSDKAPRTTKKCNITQGNWIGLVNTGPSADSKYTCNTMAQNGAGYFNLNGYMGDQFLGAPGNPQSTENYWSATAFHVANQFTGIIPPIDTWHVRDAPVDNSIDLPGSGGNNISFNGVPYETNVVLDFNPGNNPSCGCTVFLPGIVEPLTQSEELALQKQFLETMSNTANTKPEYATWLENIALYKELVNDTIPVSDPDLLNFVTQTAPQNIGKLDKGNKEQKEHKDVAFADSVTVSGLDSLKAILINLKTEQEGITQNNILELYNKQLNLAKLSGMIRSYENKGQNLLANELQKNPLKNPFEILYPLNQNEKDILIQIALLCPYYHGDVVYEARAILKVLTNQDYFNECELFNPGDVIRNSSADFPEPSIDLNMYPNPANDQVTLELITLDDEFQGGYIQITDALGRIIYQKNTLENPVVINTTDFAAGTYIVSYQLPDKTNIIKKLIVN